MCGLDIDVPAMAWNNWPGAPSAAAPIGDAPARICKPGAVMSGFTMSGAVAFGPRDEKYVVDGAVANSEFGPGTNVATGLAVTAMYVFTLTPSEKLMWTVGT